MKSGEFLDVVRGEGIGILDIPTMARVIGKDRRYASLYARRLSERNMLGRLERGLFTTGKVAEEVMATNLTFPSYLSFWSGLRFHDATTQIPVIHHVVNTTQSRRIREPLEVQFIKFPPEKVFGYKRVMMKGGWASIARLEKVLVDILYHPSICPVSELEDALERVDPDLAVSYALRMGSNVLLKRLGYCLSLVGHDVHPRIGHLINGKYDLLDPLRGREGERDRRWKLIINDVILDANW